VLRQVALLCVALFATACYSYTPIQVGAVQPGVDVRARVSAAAGERIAPLLGTTPRVLTGKFISDVSDTIILEVPTVTQATIGSTVQTLHQRVSLSKSDVIEWEIRTLDRRRTYALVIGAAAVAVSVLIKLKGEPGSDQPPGNGGVDNLVPLFRLSR
jgi:hypothetical protein